MTFLLELYSFYHLIWNCLHIYLSTDGFRSLSEKHLKHLKHLFVQQNNVRARERETWGCAALYIIDVMHPGRAMGLRYSSFMSWSCSPNFTTCSPLWTHTHTADTETRAELLGAVHTHMRSSPSWSTVTHLGWSQVCRFRWQYSVIIYNLIAIKSVFCCHARVSIWCFLNNSFLIKEQWWAAYERHGQCLWTLALAFKLMRQIEAWFSNLPVRRPATSHRIWTII